MKSNEFVKKAIDIANNYKTLYVMGCFGSPLNEKNKARYTTNNSYNKKSARKKMINAASSDTFGFDCVCLIKGILWGWNGDKNKTYGGAKYASNGVPDIGADTIINSTYCNDVSKDFKNIQVGEIVWMSGHVGIYIGDGLAVECSPKWNNDVQITAVANIGKKSGYNARKWTKHGKLKYIDYSDAVSPKPETKPETKDKIKVDGVWGEATTRKAQKVFGTKIDGVVSNQYATYKTKNPGLSSSTFEWESKPGKGGSSLIKAIQKKVGIKQDGYIGPNTIKAMQKWLGTTQDGKVSKPSKMVKAFQTWLNEQ